MIEIATLLPDWMKSEDIMGLIAGMATLAVIAIIWNGLLVKDALPGRIKALNQRRATLKSNLVNQSKKRSKLIVHENLMHRIVKKMQLMRGERARLLGVKLARAGWRSKDAMVSYLFAKIAAPLLLGTLGGVYFLGSNPFEWTLPVQFLAVAGTIGTGFFLPNIIYRNAVSKRYEAIRKSLPDALDLLVICTEAGLNLDSGLQRVCREVVNSAPELADEFGMTSVELGFLPDRKAALTNLSARVDLQAMVTFVNTLLQTEKYGTPVAVALRVLSAEMREERLMKAEEKAARLPAIMTVPMIIFILPALFIVLIGPAVLKAIDAFSGGS